jgi:hypothetical protein
MLSKNQIDNNCYAYACRIATSSWPQPGRASALKGSVNLDLEFTVGDDQAIYYNKNFTVGNVRSNAIMDGLIYAGQTRPAPGSPSHGSLVALLFAQPIVDAGYFGDYHWVRCDDPSGYAQWSHKVGSEQPTNYDFAGELIADPTQATWNALWFVGDDRVPICYEFDSFLWVPSSGVNII